MRRGDLVTIAVAGDYGKPRPALVVQADVFAGLPSVTVLQLTSDVHEAHLVRVTVTPTEANGLREVSQVMIDRAMTVPRTKVGQVFGSLSAPDMMVVDRAMVGFFSLEGAVHEVGGFT